MMNCTLDMSDLIETDVLVIGSGIAGCTVALQLADAGVAVTLVTRAQEASESNTFYAQGGIIYQGVGDSPQALAEDIERAGAGHSYPPAVSILASEGPERVRQMLLGRAGVEFDRNEDGSLSLVREGGHTIPRIVHAADATGMAVETGLIRTVAAHPNIRLLTGCTAIDLLTPAHHARNRLAVYERRAVVGAYLFCPGLRDKYSDVWPKAPCWRRAVWARFLADDQPRGRARRWRGHGLPRRRSGDQHGVRAISPHDVP